MCLLPWWEQSKNPNQLRILIYFRKTVLFKHPLVFSFSHIFFPTLFSYSPISQQGFFPLLNWYMLLWPGQVGEMYVQTFYHVCKTLTLTLEKSLSTKQEKSERKTVSSLFSILKNLFPLQLIVSLFVFAFYPPSTAF